MTPRCTCYAPTVDGSTSRCRRSGTASACRSSAPPRKARYRGPGPELGTAMQDWWSWLFPAVDVGPAERARTGGHEREFGIIDLTDTGRVTQLQRGLVVMVETVDVALGEQA